MRKNPQLRNRSDDKEVFNVQVQTHSNTLGIITLGVKKL